VTAKKGGYEGWIMGAKSNKRKDRDRDKRWKRYRVYTNISKSRNLIYKMEIKTNYSCVFFASYIVCGLE
jgi:hypothetical protein